MTTICSGHARRAATAALLGLLCNAPLFAQGPKIETQQLADRLSKQMTGAVLEGTYTDGEGGSFEDRYDIEEAKRVGEGDLWIFKARIRYGELDTTLPVPLRIKWAGQTPVITLDQVTLPGLGTFRAYVVLDGDLYAGTWHHDDKGGHMFGKIKRPTAKAAAAGEQTAGEPAPRE